MSIQPAPSYSRRGLYFLFIAVAVGIAAGALTYDSTPNAAAAAVAGVITFLGTIAWLVTLDIAMLATLHGLVLAIVATCVGGVIVWLTCLAGQTVSLGVLAGAPIAAAALVLLQKLVP